jgi:hypothetical protein
LLYHQLFAFARRRTNDRQIGFGALQKLSIVGHKQRLRQSNLLEHRRYAGRLLITDTNQFEIRIALSRPQKIPHMHMVEIDPNDFQFRGHRSTSLLQSGRHHLEK